MDGDLSRKINLLFEKCSAELSRDIDKIKNEMARRGILNSSDTIQRLLDALKEKGEQFINDEVAQIIDHFKIRNQIPDEGTENEVRNYLRNRIDDFGGKIRGEFKKIGRVPDYYSNEIDSIKSNVRSLIEIKIQDLKYRVAPSKPSSLLSQGPVISGTQSSFAKNKDIFLAHRFEEEELIEKLKNVITREDYNCKEGTREDLGSISEDILLKIKNCGFFIALMTKKDKLASGLFTTSSWLLEEKGAALAFGHRPLIMAEREVDRHYVGFLQSDDEMIFFDRSNFDEKIEEAIRKIDNTYKKHTGKFS